ncbi:MAG: galactokinase, partial [Planctomycetota bacterium]
LRDLYRCSHPALDAIVESLRGLRGIHGARLTGAGWGGCVVALAEPGMVPEGAVRLVSDDGLCRLA